MRRFLARTTIQSLVKPVLYIGLSLLGGIANYLFFPIAKHYVGLEDFGNVAAYTSIISVFSALLIAHQLYAIAYFIRNNHKQHLEVMLDLRDKALLFCAGFSVLYVLGGWVLFSILHIDDARSFWLIFIYLWVMLIANLVASYWHAKSHLLKLAVFTVATSVVQLGITILLLQRSAEPYQAIAGLLIGQLAVLGVSLIRFKDVRYFVFLRRKLAISRKRFIDLLLITAPSLLVYVFINVDIFIVKGTLADADAGYYASFSTMMKIVFYVVVPIAGVFLPRISGAVGRQVLREIKMLGILSFATIVVAWLGGIIAFPIIFKLLFNLSGPNITALYPLLLPALMGLSAIYIITLTLIIKRQYTPALMVSFSAVVATLAASSMLSPSITIAPLSLCLGSLLGCIVAIGIYRRRILDLVRA